MIVKNFPSSFFQTDLGAQLEQVGRPDLVLTGCARRHGASRHLAGISDLFAVVAGAPEDIPG